MSSRHSLGGPKQKTPEQVRQKIERMVEFEPNTGCWLWSGMRDTCGYGSLRLRGWPHGAHRGSWVAHRGPIADGLWVLHRCDTPACVNPDHLWLGTRQDNISDMNSKGRASWGANPRRGEIHGSAKLSDADIAQIRSRYVRGRRAGNRTLLAQEFRVSPSHIAKIAKGVTRVSTDGLVATTDTHNHSDGEDR